MIKSANRATTPAADRTIVPTPSAGADQTLSKSGEPILVGAIDRDFRAAPETFRASGVANWDGSRTLRGIWVAHPLATEAMRVRIVNPANNRAADGALFRRDSRLSGPSLLISSDAAQAIGLAPGQDQALQIFGLERIVEPVSPLPGAISAQLDESPPAPVTEDRPAAVAQTLPAPALKPIEDEPPGPEVIVETTEDGDAIASYRPNQASTASPAKPAIAAAPAATTSETIEAAGAGSEQVDPIAEITAAVENVSETSEPVTATETETVSAALEEAPNPEPTTTQTDTPTAPATPLKKRFLQVGVFGVAENAARLVKNLKARDVPALSREIKRDDGTTLQRVVAGPFDKLRERDRAIREIKALGISDAVPVRG